MFEDHESTDLEGAAYLESMRELGWSDDGDDPSEWDERDLDTDYERAEALGNPETEGFYPEWNGADDTSGADDPAAGELYNPEIHYVDFLPQFDDQDLPF